MAKDVIMPQGLIDLRAELKRMQAVARRHNGGKGYSIVSFDKIADFERKISAMEQEIARLIQEHGSGSAFKGESSSKSRYGPTEAQINAARANIQEWNRLRSKYGTKKAKEIAARRRNLKKTFKEEGSGSVPLTGSAAHDRYTAIMDSLPPELRDKIRDENDSEDVLEAGSRWLEEDEFEEGEYMDADVAQELIDSWLKWSAE